MIEVLLVLTICAGLVLAALAAAKEAPEHDRSAPRLSDWKDAGRLAVAGDILAEIDDLECLRTCATGEEDGSYLEALDHVRARILGRVTPEGKWKRI